MAVNIGKDDLRKIQKTQLELLCEVDRICKIGGIHYNIIAGTLLGAVRHGGFIPWDDDADVALLRTEYERFVKYCKKYLDTERFYFQDHAVTPGYRWGYGKLRKKETLYVRDRQEHMPYEQGIFIDIFPLDGVPDNYLLRTVKNLECFVVRKLLYSEVGRVADNNPMKRVLYSIMSRVPLEKIYSYYDHMVKKAAKADKKSPSRMVRILTFPTPNSEYGYLRCWYETSEDISFEGKMFSGIKDFDSYLCFKFGDYNKIPPVEKRKTHPVSKLKV